MNKNIFSSVLLAIILTLVSCGGSDISPPNETKPDQKPTEPTFGFSEVLGDKRGIVTVSLKIGDGLEPVSTNATAFISESDDEKGTALMYISTPTEITSIVTLSNFQKNASGYTFNVGGYTPKELKGSSIPQYIKNWYPNNTISKVIYGKMEGTAAIYDAKSGKISFTYTANVDIYQEIDGEEILFTANQVIYYSYSNLQDK